jgi:chromosomal replication initiator protein
MAMFLCRELTGSSLPQIGKEFGGKHHTTVLHSIRKVEGKRNKDPKFESTLSELVNRLR